MVAEAEAVHEVTVHAPGQEADVPAQEQAEDALLHVLHHARAMEGAPVHHRARETEDAHVPRPVPVARLTVYESR